MKQNLIALNLKIKLIQFQEIKIMLHPKNQRQLNYHNNSVQIGIALSTSNRNKKDLLVVQKANN